MDTPNPATSAQWFALSSSREKIHVLPEVLAAAESSTVALKHFDLGRDVEVLLPWRLPPKVGLSHAKGQARLIHDLASIELQAMELAVRTLVEYPEAPTEFKKELSEIALGEARHLKLCLDALDDMSEPWGSWPVHLALWDSVGMEDSLLDRILLVHRHLEGSGLDAGESILRRLTSVDAHPAAKDAMKVIVEEEVEHVHFGSRWYRKVAESLGLDADHDFKTRFPVVANRAPRREPIAYDLRLKAGFTENELEVVERVRLGHQLRQTAKAP